MKKINSIHYGSRVIGIGLIFLVPVPLALWGVNQWLQKEILSSAAYVSMVIGAAIEIFFFVYLIIETKQDKKINEYYQRHKKSKITLPGGRFECGNCGNRNVRESDTGCVACGITFEMETTSHSTDS